MGKQTAYVAPSILSGDFAALGNSVRLAQSWGADWIHCDVMDGVYVDNITFGMPMVAALRPITRLPLDVHLMITRPERYVARFVQAGADYVTFHPEASEDAAETLRRIHAAGAKGGIALNPNVPFSDWAHLLGQCDLLLVMSVYAGKGGQAFLPETYQKLSQITAYMAETGVRVPIEVDGGVGEGNAAALRRAGVEVLVAGSAIFHAPSPADTIRILSGK